MTKRSAAGVRFFNLPGMEHAEAVCATEVSNDFPRHIHTGFCIGIVDRGQRVILQGGVETVIPENGLFVINPGVAHTCRSFDPSGHSYRILCISIEFMKTCASQISEKARQIPWFPDLSIPWVRNMPVSLITSFHLFRSPVQSWNGSWPL